MSHPAADRYAWIEPDVEDLGAGIHRIPLPLPLDGLHFFTVIRGRKTPRLRDGRPRGRTRRYQRARYEAHDRAVRRAEWIGGKRKWFRKIA